MRESLTSDTNILIYAFDPADPVRHPVSIRIMAAMTSFHSVLPMQCLAEFYSVTTRKRFLDPNRAIAIARRLIDTLHIVPADLSDLVRAMDLQRNHGLQTFDAMLIATSVRARCTVFFSEDMQHTRAIDGLTIVNPFQLTPAELDRLLA